MADTPSDSNDQQGETPPFLIGVQYIKDLSFENPNGIETLSAMQQGPEISVDVSTNARQLSADGMFEVSLFIRAEATAQGRTGFIVELTYAGVVQVSGLPEEQIKPAVLIEGPRYLFPFARNIVSNAVRDGGFPPLMINPIDFAALYVEQHVDSEGANI